MRLLELDTLSDQNITSALLVGSYTATADRKIMVQVFIKQVAGNGTYYAYVTHDPLASGTFYEVSPRTSASVPSGVTSIAFTTIPLAVLNTDIVRVYVIGLAGDTTTPDITVRWLEDDHTISAAQVAAAVDEPLNAGTLNKKRGDSWVLALTDIGALTGYTSIWFSIKSDKNQTDAEAIVQIKKNASGSGDGLLYLNNASGSQSVTGSWGTITIDYAATGDITIRLDEAATLQLDIQDGYHYDVQVLNSGSITTLTEGRFNVTGDVTRATS